MAAPLSLGPPELLHDLTAVEKALERLWQATAPRNPEQGSAVMRAASFNVVAMAPSEAEGQAAAAVLAAVTTELPGRVLVLCVEPGPADGRVEAWVAMHCRAIGGGAQVCGEQVVVVERGGDVERLGGAAAALLLPDCPVIGWWRGGPGPAAPLLDRLARVLDAVLLDGSRFDPVSLPRWVARAHGPGARTAVGDLAWERSAAWRRWTADLFEPAELRPGLERIAALTVACGADQAMTALLYVGWVATALGWRMGPGLAPAADGVWTGTLRGRDGPVIVAVRPGGPAAGLAEVTIETRGPQPVRCVLTRDETRCVTLSVTRGRESVLRRVVREPEPGEIGLVGQWLERPRWDPVYGAALAALAEFSRPPEGKGSA
jgi:glucose-6-phosphate dehydrogenase assembly protein OpcA